MKKVLIAYGTTEGHTRKIANRISEWTRAAGAEATVVDTANIPNFLKVSGFDAFILAGSLHMSKHQSALVHFAKQNRAAMDGKPTAFISASLTSVIKDANHVYQAQECIDEFFRETGWRADVALPVAGALLYTEYDWVKRALLKMIAKKEGGDTDTSKDYEYTDWNELRVFVDIFLREHGLSSQSKAVFYESST